MALKYPNLIPKYTKIGLFGLKIYHPATLHLQLIENENDQPSKRHEEMTLYVGQCIFARTLENDSIFRLKKIVQPAMA
jgi:hypothetical protein